MNERSLKLCEFSFILDTLAELTETPMGKELALALRPSSDKEEIMRSSLETEEARKLFLYMPPPSLYGIVDIKPFVLRTNMGAILEPSELFSVAVFLSRLPEVKRYLKGENLSRLKGDIILIPSLQEAIEHAIDEEGNIKPNASSKLTGIRRHITKLEESIRRYLESHISGEWSGFVQEGYITIRNGRYVIPVKSSQKRFIKSIVHDVSQSGNTFFVEPYDVVDMNNALQEAKKEEEYEIQRILRELSLKVSNHSEELLSTRDVIAHIDFIFAKARLSLQWKCVPPVWIDKPLVRLRGARHPILGKRAIPIDVEIGDRFNILVISGPNTGGKTVTLKTVGLFVMMAQSGLHLPTDLAEMGIFDDVFVEIGDEQSINQDLSSFSAHLTHIIPFLNESRENTLVLIDEPVTGTSPKEGAVLAISILEELREKGAKVIVASHYDELKMWASNSKDVINGAMEFDPETFLPTYKLHIGRPGVSNAFVIARKLGIDEKVIERAERLLSSEELDLVRLLEQLDQLERNLNSEIERAKREKEISEELRKRYESLLKELSDQQKLMLRRAKEEARNLVVQTKIQLDKIYNKAKTSSRKEIASLKERLEEVGSTLREEEDIFEGERVRELNIGMRVFVPRFNQNGEVIGSNGDKATILLGNVKVDISKDELYIPKVEKKVKEEDNILQIKREKAGLPNTLYIRKLSVEEALTRLEKYIDDAVLAGISPIYIVHGKGTGVLRKLVANFLKDHPMVESFRLGEYNEGGWGVTVAYLKGL
ncbi:MAG: endonuclease MutS2 [bacterium]